MKKPNIQFIDVDGLLCRTVIVHGQGTPIVCLNGLGANLELSFPFIEKFEGKTVLAFDFPGVGGSEAWTLPKSPRAIAAFVHQLCENMGFEKVNLIGLSWGGGLAQQIAHQYPEFCHRLVLAATSTGSIMFPGGWGILKNLATRQRFQSANWMNHIAAELYGGHLREDPEQVDKMVKHMLAPSLKGYWHQLTASIGWTSLFWLHRLQQPTLIMTGDDDPIVPLVNAKLMAMLIPHNKLHIIPGGGHLFLLDHSNDAIPTIRDFLRD